MNDATANRRRFQRFRMEGIARLYSAGAMWETGLVDVSLRGVMVTRPDGWDGAVGNRYRLDVRIEGGVMLGMAVELARVVDVRLAFAWTRVDLDSFIRLKRLVELNLGNSELFTQELASID
jgi:hypothetical protein